MPLFFNSKELIVSKTIREWGTPQAVPGNMLGGQYFQSINESLKPFLLINHKYLSIQYLTINDYLSDDASV